MCYRSVSAEDADSTITTSPAAASSADASHAAKCHAVWNKRHDASATAPSTTDGSPDGATNAWPHGTAAKSTDDNGSPNPIATSTSSYATSVSWALTVNGGPLKSARILRYPDIDDFLGWARIRNYHLFFQ